MRPREDALPRLERALRLHPRKRLVLMEELRADLDALEDELAARGLPRSQAREAAARRVLPDAETARALELEAAAWPRLAGRAGDRALRAAERAAIALVAVLVAVALGLGMARLRPGGPAAGFAAAMAIVISLIAAHTVHVGQALWLRQDLRADGRREAGRIHLGLVLVAVSLSGLGATVVAYDAAGALASRAAAPGVFALVRDVALLVALGLGAVLIGRLGWLALTPSFRSYETFERRIAALFLPTGPTLHRPDHRQEVRP